jgi:hypothetical protein
MSWARRVIAATSVWAVVVLVVGVAWFVDNKNDDDAQQDAWPLVSELLSAPSSGLRTWMHVNVALLNCAWLGIFVSLYFLQRRLISSTPGLSHRTLLLALATALMGNVSVAVMQLVPFDAHSNDLTHGVWATLHIVFFGTYALITNVIVDRHMVWARYSTPQMIRCVALTVLIVTSLLFLAIYRIIEPRSTFNVNVAVWLQYAMNAALISFIATLYHPWTIGRDKE